MMRRWGRTLRVLAPPTWQVRVLSTIQSTSDYWDPDVFSVTPYYRTDRESQ